MLPVPIMVGSLSPHKLKAVQDACTRLGINAIINGVKAESRQNAQPVGYKETVAGAYTRAMQAFKSAPCLAIGIESGIFGWDGPGGQDLVMDHAVIALITPQEATKIVVSAGIPFPGRYVESASMRGFAEVTVGKVIAEELGGDATDPHAILTKGKIKRNDLISAAVELALLSLDVLPGTEN